MPGWIISKHKGSTKEKKIERSRRLSKIMTLNEATCSLINLQNSITGKEIDYLLANKGTSRKDKCVFQENSFSICN